MSSLGNMKNNISPKARMMLGLTVVGIIGVVGFTVVRLGGSNEITNGEGVAELNMPPTKGDISKDKPLDAVRFDDKTEIGQLYKKDEDKRAQTAIKNNTSHIDDIRLMLKDETVKPVKVVPVEPAQSKLDMLRAERKKTEEATDREQQSRAAKQSQTSFQENPWKSFLDSERAQYSDYETLLGYTVAGLRPSGSLPTPSYESTGSDANGNFGDISSSGVSSTGGGYEQYLTGNNQGNGNIQGSALRGLRADEESKTTANRAGTSMVAQDEIFEAEPDYPSEKIAKAAVKTTISTGVIAVGQTFYSVLQIGVNTDEISPIRAVAVESGRLKGAVLTGSPMRTGEKAMLTFSSMSLNGRSYQVNAIALDPETYRSGIADSVNNHTFERYSKLFAAAFVEGYSDALSGTQTTTNTDGSTSETKDPMPDSTAQVKVGIGAIGKKMTPIFEKEFDRPPTVTVEPNKSIIIMFMQEVDLGV